MPSVSVIIPVHNRRALLERAMDSVARQSFGDFECIVVDDASDRPCDDLPGFADSRFTCLRLSCRSGVSRARNEGVKRSSAPWIAFLDSDDVWMTHKLLRQIEWTRRNPCFKIVQCREIWIRNGVRVNPPKTHEKRQGDLFAESLERCMITPSSVMLRRGLFYDMDGFNESLPACEDYDLWLRICVHYPVGLVDEYLLVRYGGHDDQLSSSVAVLDRFRIRALLGLLHRGELTVRQESLVRKQLIKRASVCAQGYGRRGNRERYEQYRTIASEIAGEAVNA